MSKEEDVALKKLRIALKKITSLKHARRILNSEIKKQEEEVERIRSKYPSKFEEYRKKLRESLDKLEQELE